MGTNYYAIPKATDDLKLRIINAVNANDFETAAGLIPCKIHVGKSSIGWVFTFNNHNWTYFNKSLLSMVAFYLTCDLWDEYGRIVSQSDFWQLVDKKQKDGRVGYLPDGCTVEFGLNFCTSTDFS